MISTTTGSGRFERDARAPTLSERPASTYGLDREAIERIHRRVAALTRTPTKPSTSEWVTLVIPPGAPLDLGFERARTSLNNAGSGAGVRLIGHGVTLERVWPDWVRQEHGGRLILTELGAYALESRVTPWSIALRDALGSWLRSSTQAALGDISADGALLPWARIRFQDFDNDPSMFVYGLLAAHGDTSIESVEPAWAGAKLMALLRANDHPQSPDPVSTVRFGLAVGVGSAIAWPLAAGRAIRDHARARSARRRLEELNRAFAGDEPDAWFALLPTWPRFNAHLVGHLSEWPNERLGILTIHVLQEGARNESNLKIVRSSELFSGLAPVRAILSQSPVENMSGVATPSALASTLVRSALATTRAVARIVRHGPLLPMKGATLDLSKHVSAIVKVATVDVLEAIAGDAAARGVVRRHDMRGKAVVFSTSAPPSVAAACARLQANGAITVEHFHGLATGGASGAGQVKCLWTYPEVAERDALGERTIVAGMPPQKRPRERRAPQGPARILFLTNYAHRDTLRGKTLPLQCFQDEMIAAAQSLATGGPSVTLRWRPHPADVESAVRATLEQCPSLTLAREGQLSHELAQADIIVSSVSTSLIESLLVGAPVFAHLIPEYQDLHLTRFLSPERTFFRADELAPKVFACLRAWTAGDAEAMAPERAARIALFGPEGHPASLFEAVRSLGNASSVRES